MVTDTFIKSVRHHYYYVIMPPHKEAENVKTA